MRGKANFVRWPLSVLILLVAVCTAAAGSVIYIDADAIDANGGSSQASRSDLGAHVKYGGGTGEPNDPYLIYTAEQMNTIGANPGEWDKHFKLMADIDLSTYTGNQFNIIGGNPAFTGVFDGDGHTISNFTYVSTDPFAGGGLFGSVNDPNAEIKNLRLIDPNVVAEDGYGVGLLIAGLSQGLISNCHVENGRVAGFMSVGGLVGAISGYVQTDIPPRESGGVRHGEGILRYCSTNGVYVSGDSQVGGLVGEHRRGTITHCHSTGTVVGNELVGGLLGDNFDTISDCFSTALVIGEGLVGGLVGHNGAGANGRIMHCCSSSSVSGDWAVGGLVGMNSTRISNCYSTGDVIGNEYVGGLVGSNSKRAWIGNCYSIGRVTGDAEVGGLVGSAYEDGDHVRGSFWDIETSGQTTSTGGTGKTRAEMQTASTFLDAGWDFVGETLKGTEDIWWIDEGKDYPRLWWELLVKYGGGTGEPDDPYLIYTAEQMNEIGLHQEDWDKHFKLMADIDLSGYTGTDFNIIGDGFLPAFTGVFDGNGHTISNFTYTSTNSHSIGIFGYIDGLNSRISDLGLIDPNVNGGTSVDVGSLAGLFGIGTITNCYVTGGNITGGKSVGGLIGTCAGIITDCYAVGGRVIAEGSAGGLVGSCSASMIDCYATGNVTGSHRIGGLAGSNSGSIVDSYSHASVEGRDVVGGLVGYNYKGIVTNCFSTSGVTGKNSTGGLVGENEGQVVDCYCSCTLDAQNQVGGLVGINDGVITASYSSAGIHGRDEIGGLVGYNTDSAEIVNCYANGDVIGRSYVGGLVGNNATVFPRAGKILSGTIRNCYSVTLVSGDQNVGGLIGHFGEDGVSGSFWDIEASGLTTSDGGVGKTTHEMQDPNTFIDAGWDFAGAPGGPGDIWAEPEGGGYLVLTWQLSPPPELPTFSGGTGEHNDPYLVSTANELNSIGHNPRLMIAHFRLINDIDLTGVDFYIMASRYYPFRGTFDGNDHTISNFSYTSPEATGVGLFGYVSNGRIKNLGLIDPNVHVDKGDFHGCLVGRLAAGIITHCYVESGSVTGQDELGGLVGENGYGGVIMNCYFTGEATGKENVGGLVGNNRGSITTSYSYADVEGRIAVGGLVGRCSRGETVNCYARGNVVGQWYVGGLAGTNGSGSLSSLSPHSRTGSIRNCYSASTTLMGSQKGGLLGADWGGEVRGSFWDIETSGQTTSYGGEGKTTAEMQAAGTFLDAGWDFVGETENGTNDIWNICEGQDHPRLTCQFTVGDFDNDGDVDFRDFGLLASRWHKTDSSFWCGGGGTDLTNDGYVDFADLALMILHFSQEG